MDWDERSDTSEWSGVSLDTEDRILGLNVANRNLSGELPAALGEISKLEYLHATSNFFTGEPIKFLANSYCSALPCACDVTCPDTQGRRTSTESTLMYI